MSSFQSGRVRYGLLSEKLSGPPAQAGGVVLAEIMNGRQ